MEFKTVNGDDLLDVDCTITQVNLNYKVTYIPHDFYEQLCMSVYYDGVRLNKDTPFLLNEEGISLYSTEGKHAFHFFLIMSIILTKMW